MDYCALAVTDVGIKKQTNQDGVCIRVADTKEVGQIAMAVICDGMGGLSKGEVVSTTVVRAFSDWFERVAAQGLSIYSMEEVSEAWKQMLKEENQRILEFGRKIHVNMGTTCSALFLMGNEYVIVHVGDTRIYTLMGECHSLARSASDTRCLKGTVRQLTADQTYVAREVRLGNMTPEQARTHAKRSVLLQCVGASREVEPQVVLGEVRAGTVFLLCSDGFRHMLSEQEMHENLYPVDFGDVGRLEKKGIKLVELVKERGEKDNISVAVVQCGEARQNGRTTCEGQKARRNKWEACGSQKVGTAVCKNQKAGSEEDVRANVGWREKLWCMAKNRKRERMSEQAMETAQAAEMKRPAKSASAAELEQTAELPTLELKDIEITKILQSITMVHANEVINH